MLSKLDMNTIYGTLMLYGTFMMAPPPSLLDYPQMSLGSTIVTFLPSGGDQIGYTSTIPLFLVVCIHRNYRSI